MADLKISALTASTVPLAGTEVLPIVQSSTTKQVSVANLTAGRAVAASSVTTTAASEFGVSAKISQTASPTLYFYSTSANSSARNWGVQSNNTAFGDMAINTSTAINGDPIAAGATRIYFDRLGGTTIGGTTSAGAGNLLVQTGNVTQGTAAKGINFTANTPAAGMTSQLLNWYEEGTWTPVLVGWTNVGTPTVTGRYVRIGLLIYVEALIIPATTCASTAPTSYITGLPFSAAVSSVCTWANASSGLGLGTGLLYTTGWLYAPTISATANQITVSGTYRK